MKRLDVIKTFFERTDKIAPDGGRMVQSREMIELKKAGENYIGEIAELCAQELNVTLD